MAYSAIQLGLWNSKHNLILLHLLESLVSCASHLVRSCEAWMTERNDSDSSSCSQLSLLDDGSCARPFPRSLSDPTRRTSYIPFLQNRKRTQGRWVSLLALPSWQGAEPGILCVKKWGLLLGHIWMDVRNSAKDPSHGSGDVIGVHNCEGTHGEMRQLGH